jgi:hypothetical protein
MTIPTRHVVGWSALLGIGVVIALVRMPPSGAPNDPVAVDADAVVNDADARIDVRHDEHPQEQQTEAAITGIAAPPKTIPQNVEDLRAGNPLLAPIIEANEQTLAAEAKDPLWSTNMETRIVNEIAQKALGLELADLQVDCRTTLCRVEMTFPLQLLQKKFEPDAENAVWNGRQPVNSFLKALDLNFRDHVAGGLNQYGTPVVVGYVNRPPEKTNE